MKDLIVTPNSKKLAKRLDDLLSKRDRLYNKKSGKQRRGQTWTRAEDLELQKCLNDIKELKEVIRS